MLDQEVVNDPFGHGYEYLGVVLIVDVPKFGKKSVVKTFQSLFNGQIIQLHEAGFYRTRNSPNRENPFPALGEWIKSA